jgi:lysophospholipase L1-like esterase
MATALPSERYVALGDSVAAGLGVGASTGGSQEDVLCGRSNAAYPVRVAKSLNMSLEQYACSGAQANDGIYGDQEVGNTEIAAQLDRAFASGTPDVITVTIGANDVHWSQFIKQCYLWDCGTRFDELQFTAYQTHFRWEMYRTLSLIQAKAGGTRATMPKVYFTGYFQPFSSSNPSCANTRNFTAAEISWLNGNVNRLNQTIRDSVSWYGFARYVPVSFAGHELCSSTPWIQGMQANAPFHPTASGQRAYARAVLSAIR